MNKFIRTIALIIVLAAFQGCGFAAENPQKSQTPLEEVVLELPADNAVDTQNASVEVQQQEENSNSEDVDLDAIEDELPENNNDIQSAVPRDLEKTADRTQKYNSSKELEGNLEAEYSFFFAV